MNPLDRSSAPPSPQQEAQASSSQQANSSLEANIANVGIAGASQPVTIPLVASASQFAPVVSNSDIHESSEGDFYHILKASNEQVITALLEQNITFGSEDAIEQVNAHRVLLDGIRIPVFTYRIRLNYMVSKDRLALQSFIKELLTRLEGQTCYYDPVNFISSLLMQGDRQHTRSYQTLEELKKIVETYIPNLGERKYLQTNWNIDWPNHQEVRRNQNKRKQHVDSITLEIKKRIYLKMEELENALADHPKRKIIKRAYHIDAAFAYGATPGVIQTWIKEGRISLQKESAREQPAIAEQAPRAAEQHSSPSAEISLVSEQPQAAAFIPGIVIEDDQRPGPSRSAGRASPLRFAPYQRSQVQPPLFDQNMQHKAQALGLTAEALQAFNLETQLDAEFNRQMEVLPWPRVTSDQFVQEQSSGRYVIMPATRMEIGRFIVENCPADARVYRFAALRYGVNVGEIANWVSEASD